MSLQTGTALGPYEIVALLGAGGMGEVYRARDTKLGREVAVKILPPEFAQDPERLARFQREAQLLAALNHPHIAGIYGLEEAGGIRFLVLELVEGESLAQRLEGLKPQRSGLPVAEALAIARQIVDALEAAHDKGIIHRDLKPANIMLTPDGGVKVLDFGLAKALEGDARGELSHSPTLTFAATQAGVILGTAAYMSPEQAKGRAADKRSDVWAFGCVLYEMLTGRRAFEGEDVSDTLAAILRGEPDWNAFPPEVPPHIRAIVTRALAKDRKARIPDVAVVRFLMDEPRTASAPADAAPAARQRRGVRVWQAATALSALTAIAGFGGWYAARSATTPVTRFFVLPPDGGAFVVASRVAAQVAISPDGTRLAFTARDATGKVLLWVRPIDSLTPQPLVGTDDAAFPFWSPDSRFIAYSTPSKLMRIAAGGGPPQTVCAFSSVNIVGRGGAWSRDGVIVFNNGPGPLFRVSSAGSSPSPVLRLATGQTSHNFPSFLPDGRHILFYAAASSQEVSGVYVVSLDTGESKRLLAADTGAIYTPHSGYLLFVRQGTLLAQSFDPKTLTLANDPFPIAERVEAGAIPGIVTFSVSLNGVLAYGIGTATSAGLQLVWVDRQGKTVGQVGAPANYRGLDLSPDGKRVAVYREEGQGGDIWVLELTRGTTSRFTFNAAQQNRSPIWSPDGASIVFASMRDGKWGLYRKPSNNSGNEERLLEADTLTFPMSWSPDGRSVVYLQLDRTSNADLWLLPLSGERRPVPLVHTPFTDTHGQVSPDGKWMAYHSNETNRQEVYVQPFPTGAGKWQISSNGGVFPRWRADSGELFFVARVSQGNMMAVAVRASGPTFEAGTPKELFNTGYVNQTTSSPYHTYAVSADGQRFLIPRPPLNDSQAPPASPIAVVVNWEAALKQ